MIFKGFVENPLIPTRCFEYRERLPNRWAFWNRKGSRAIRYDYRNICVNGTNSLYLSWWFTRMKRITSHIKYLLSHIAISAHQSTQLREESNSPSRPVGNGLEQVSMFST